MTSRGNAMARAEGARLRELVERMGHSTVMGTRSRYGALRGNDPGVGGGVADHVLMAQGPIRP